MVLMSDFGPPVRAETLVGAAPERIYGFLAELDNHSVLGDRYLRVERLSRERDGGVIRVGAPFGVRRTASTTVTTAIAPRRFGGTAAVGARTRAHACWEIETNERGARVALEATVCSTGILDRLLLAVGGRWWLRRRFRLTLARLAAVLEAA